VRAAQEQTTGPHSPCSRAHFAYEKAVCFVCFGWGVMVSRNQAVTQPVPTVNHILLTTPESQKRLQRNFCISICLYAYSFALSWHCALSSPPPSPLLLTPFPPLTTPHTFTPCMHASPHPHHVLPHTQRSLHRVPRVKPRSPVNSHNFSTVFTSPLTPLSELKERHCIKHPLISHSNPHFTP
jgi:hypothetical protein